MTALARIEGYGSLMEQAEVLARSNIVPKAFRGKPADVVVAMLLGQELGLGPMATMSMVDVIEGNATLNAEGKVSLVRKAGHSISGASMATKAVAHGKRADTGDEMTVEWTIQMAQRAGLATKQVWKQYPEAMLWSRAVSQLCRMLFSDVLAGLSYTPEEVEAFSGIESTSPDRPADLPALSALPPADPETDEVIDAPSEPTTRRRPPPAIVSCPEGCDVTAPSKQVMAEHLVADHGWTVDDHGKVHPPKNPTQGRGDDDATTEGDAGRPGSPAMVPPATTGGRGASEPSPASGGGEGRGSPAGAAPRTSRPNPPAPAEAGEGDVERLASAPSPHGDAGGGAPAAGAPPSAAQRGMLHSLIAEKGIADRHQWAADVLGREVASYSDLTSADYRVLIDAAVAAPEALRLGVEA